MPKYPYVSSSGPLAKTIEQLQRSFPSEVNSQTLKKLGFAPNNESYVLNTLRFLGVIDESGKKADDARVFQQRGEAFATAFEGLVRSAYAGLFELYAESAWELPKDTLITFFRNSDDSTEIVGSRQATTFQALASIAGHGAPAVSKAPRAPGSQTPVKARSQKTKVQKDAKQGGDAYSGIGNGRVGVTVRIELNLPSTNDQDVYDKIFRSLRENLIDEPGLG